MTYGPLRNLNPCKALLLLWFSCLYFSAYAGITGSQCDCVGGGLDVKLHLELQGTGSATAKLKHGGGEIATLTRNGSGHEESKPLILAPGADYVIEIQLSGVEPLQNPPTACDPHAGGYAAAYVIAGSSCSAIESGSFKGMTRIGVSAYKYVISGSSCEPTLNQDGVMISCGGDCCDEDCNSCGSGEYLCEDNTELTKTVGFTTPKDGQVSATDKGNNLPTENGSAPSSKDFPRGPSAPPMTFNPDSINDHMLYNQTLALGLEDKGENAGIIFLYARLTAGTPLTTLTPSFIPRAANGQFSGGVLLETVALGWTRIWTSNRVASIKQASDKSLKIDFYRSDQYLDPRIENPNGNPRWAFILKTDAQGQEEQPFASYHVTGCNEPAINLNGIKCTAVVNGIQSVSEHYALKVPDVGWETWTRRDGKEVHTSENVSADPIVSLEEESVKINGEWVLRRRKEEEKEQLTGRLTRVIEGPSETDAISDTSYFYYNTGKLRLEKNNLNGFWKRYLYETSVQTSGNYPVAYTEITTVDTPWIGASPSGSGRDTPPGEGDTEGDDVRRTITSVTRPFFAPEYNHTTKAEEFILGVAYKVTETVSVAPSWHNNGKMGTLVTTTVRPSARSTNPILTKHFVELDAASYNGQKSEKFSQVTYPDGRFDVTVKIDATEGGFSPRSERLQVTWETRTSHNSDGTVRSESSRRLENGRIVKAIESVAASGGFYVVSGKRFEYDHKGRLTVEREGDAVMRTLSYPATNVIHDEDYQGVVTVRELNVDGTIKSETRKGVPAGAGEAQADVVTTYSTEEVGSGTKHITTTTAGAGAAQISILSYHIEDAFGRTVEEMDEQKDVNEQGRVTRYRFGYGEGNRGDITTVYLPGHSAESPRRQVTETNVDGRVKKIWGEAVDREEYSYLVTLNGCVATSHAKGPNSERVWVTVEDPQGNVVSEAVPGQGTTVHEFDPVSGRKRSSQRTGFAKLLYEYDPNGDLQRYGYSISGGPRLNTSSNDRITKVSSTYEKDGGGLWKVDTHEVLTSPMSDSGLKTTRREKIGGGVSRIRKTITPDGVENEVETMVERQLKKVTQTTSSTLYPSERKAVQVAYNGRIASASTFTVSAASTYHYDAMGRLTQVKDPRTGSGSLTAYKQDGRIESVTDADGYVTSYQYYGSTQFGSGALPGELSATIRPGVGVVAERYGYDAHGRMTHQWGNGAYPVRWEYDGHFGELVKMHTYRSESDWNNENLPAGFSQAGDQTTWVYYPATGLLEKKTDALNHSVHYTYYDNGLLETRRWARDAEPVKTSYSYTPAGELTLIDYYPPVGVTPPAGFASVTPDVSIQYDRAGRPEKRVDGAGSTTLVYNGPGGVLSSAITSNAPVPLTRSQPPGLSAGTPGTPPVLPNRNNLQSDMRTTYSFQSSSGKKKSAFAAEFGGKTLTQVGYGYDTITGRLETVTLSPDTVASYEYVANSDLVWKTTAGVVVGTRTYSPAGRLAILAWTANGTTPVSNAYGFNAAGGRGTATREDATQFSYTYNGRGEVTSGKRLKEGNEMVGWRFGYRYDAIGNRVRYHSPTEGEDPEDGKAWLVNSVNQLTARNNPLRQYVLGRAETGATVSVKQNGDAATLGRDGVDFFGLSPERVDGWESLEIKAVKTGAGVLNQATPDPDDRVDAVTTRTGNLAMPPAEEALSYDEDGNLASDWRWIYEWDAENRLVAIAPTEAAVAAGVPKQRIEYGYDGLGRRIQKLILDWKGSPDYFWVVAEDRRFVYDGRNLAAEILLSTAGDILAHCAYGWGHDITTTGKGGGAGGLLFAKHFSDYSQESVWTPAFDGNGNIVSYLYPETGAVAGRFEYDPYGRVLVRERSELYTTGENSQNLYHRELPPFRFATRYEDAESGLLYYGFRYSAPDLGRWISRDPIEENGGLHLYGFTSNNPVNFLDAHGLSTIKVYFAVDQRGKRGQAVPEEVDHWVKNTNVKRPKLDANGKPIIRNMLLETRQKQLQGLRAMIAKCSAVTGKDFSGVQVQDFTNTKQWLPDRNLVYPRHRGPERNKFENDLLSDWGGSFAADAQVKVVITGAVGADLGDPDANVGSEVQGITVSPPPLPGASIYPPWQPGVGLIIIKLDRDLYVLAHELGHLLGWWNNEINDTHSKDLGNLMSWYSGEPSPDCQWCDLVFKFAK